MELRGKRILIISPEKWNNLRLSKHHYAEELSWRDNEVFYLNPPESEFTEPIITKSINNHLHLVDYNTHVKGERFIPLLLLNFIRKIQANKILQLIGGHVDIVWSFFPNQFFDLNVFCKAIKIFHPVDKIEEIKYLKTAKTADIVLSVADFLLKDFRLYNSNCHFINHGLSKTYENAAPIYKRDATKKIKVGYVGNMLRPDIDHPIFLKIIEENPEVDFVIWGSTKYEHLDWKISGQKEVIDFIKKLEQLPNVQLRGLVHPEIVASETKEMDVFLCCYDPLKEINRASNNHKLMEYLSSGKIVVSHFVETYADKRDLLMMSESYRNESLPSIFKNIISELDFWNSKMKMQDRIAFANENTYAKQIERIEKLLFQE